MNFDDAPQLGPMHHLEPPVQDTRRNGAIVLMTVTGDGAMEYVSDSARDLVGKAPVDLVGVSIGALSKKKQGSTLLQAVERAATTSLSGDVGRYWLSSTGRADVLVEVFIDAARYSETGSLHVVMLDVTGEYIDEQRLRGLSDQFQHVLGAVEMAVTRWTPAMELEFHSPAFEPLVMGTHDLLLTGPALEDVGLTDSAQRVWRDSLRNVVDSAVPIEFDWETDDHRHIHSRALAEFGADGFVASVLIVCHDVTEERERYEELTRRALYDPLTGLANRATTIAYIERSLGRRGRGATSEVAIFIDLDRFKAMNDSLGHAAGDELLVTVAKRLSSAVRPHDVVGRLGGDEFVVYLEQMDGIEPVLLIVDRLRSAISEPLVIAGRELTVKASMGVAFAADRSETAEGLLSKDSRG